MQRTHRVYFLLSYDTYEKLRHVSFYERKPVSEILRRLVIEYLEEKAIHEEACYLPRQL